VRYRYLDARGESVEGEAGGLLARCLQHEIDHLNGVLLIDRMPAAARRKVAGQLARLRQTRALDWL
jgi:peptide deformylase